MIAKYWYFIDLRHQIWIKILFLNLIDMNKKKYLNNYIIYIVALELYCRIWKKSDLRKTRLKFSPLVRKIGQIFERLDSVIDFHMYKVWKYISQIRWIPSSNTIKKVQILHNSFCQNIWKLFLKVYNKLNNPAFPLFSILKVDQKVESFDLS